MITEEDRKEKREEKKSIQNEIYLNLFFRVGEHKTGWRSSLLFGKDKTRQSRQVSQTVMTSLSYDKPVW